MKEGSREFCHCGLRRELQELNGRFYVYEKDKKTFRFIDLFIFKRLPITAVKRDEAF